MCDFCVSRGSLFSRRRFLGLATSAALGWSAASVAADVKQAPLPQNVIGPDEALKRLMEGNERYVGGKSNVEDFSAKRAALSLGQNPFACILGCSDSRVAPELAFDTGRGDLFVVRIAGNFMSTDGLASMEYAVGVLGAPLIVVLGHTACGAVKAAISTVKDKAELPGHIPSLVQSITPAVETAIQEQKTQPDASLIDLAIAANVRRTVQQLANAEGILKPMVTSGKLKVVGGTYDLPTGKINLLA
jgi:carbonic anhydrase